MKKNNMVRVNKRKCSDSEDNLTFSDDSDSCMSSEEEELAKKLNEFNAEQDSDSAPEEVTFEAEEEKHQQTQKQIATQLKQQKDLVKKKRTEMHLRNALQKKEKIKKLNEKRLPKDILESIANIPAQTQISDQTSNKTVFDHDTEKGIDERITENSEVKSESDVIDIHGSTVFKVRNLKKESKKPIPVPAEVTSFRDRVLYGKKIRREPTRSYMAKLEKQKIGGKRTVAENSI